MTISVDAPPPQVPTGSGISNVRHRVKRSSARRALTELGPNDPRRNLIFIEEVLALSQEKFREKWNFDPVTEKPLAPGQFLWSPVALHFPAPQPQSSKNPQPSPQTTSSSPATVNDRLSAPTVPATAVANSLLTAAFAATTTAASVDTHSRTPSSNHHLNQHRNSSTTTSERHSSATASLKGYQHNGETSCSVSSTGTTRAPVSVNRQTVTETRITQRKITEFGRQRKRIHSQCKFEDGDAEALGSSSSKRPANEALRVR